MKNHLSSKNLVEFSNISFSYNERKELLKDISFSIKEGGEVVCLLGSSGSGKSTMIKLLLNELEPDVGTIYLSKSHLPIFQDFERMILPWFNVKKNIIYGIDEFEIERFENVVSVLEISELLNSYPFELSGGEKQRVVLARALIRKPKIVIVDEPLSSIDIGLSKRMIPEIKNFIKLNNISSLWVTHDVYEAIKLSDIVFVIDGSGNLVKFETNKNNERDLAFLIQEIML